MDTLERIKKEIARLYEEKREIHVSVAKTRPKATVEKAPSMIVGVYKNVFQVEAKGSAVPRRYTFQYSDILIGQLVIQELGGISEESSPQGL